MIDYYVSISAAVIIIEDVHMGCIRQTAEDIPGIFVNLDNEQRLIVLSRLIQ